MALVKYGPLVENASGTIGDTTFAPGPGGAIARTKNRQCNQATTAQLAARSALSTTAKLWQTLTSTQQAAWSAAAKTRPYTNRIGEQHTLSGYQFFVKLNNTLYQGGETLLTDPPANYDVPRLTAAAALPIFTGTTTTDVLLFWNQGTASTAIVEVQATGRYSYGWIPDKKRLQKIAVYQPATTPSQLAGSAWSAVFGDLPTEPPYQIRIRYTPVGPTNGWRGCPVNYLISVDRPPPSPPPTPGTTCSSAPTIQDATPYVLAGSTTDPAWYELPVTPGSTYVIAWAQTNAGGTPTLRAGASCSALTTLHAFTQTDAFIFTALAGQNYYLNTTTWPSSSTWSFIFNLQVLEEQPTITAIHPTAGPATGGTTVTITGTNLNHVDEVLFGDYPSFHFRREGSTRLRAQAPPQSAATVDITVHADNGCSDETPGDRFRYTATMIGGSGDGGHGFSPQLFRSRGGSGDGGHGFSPQLFHGRGGSGDGGHGFSTASTLWGTGGSGDGGKGFSPAVELWGTGGSGDGGAGFDPVDGNPSNTGLWHGGNGNNTANSATITTNWSFIGLTSTPNPGPNAANNLVLIIVSIPDPAATCTTPTGFTVRSAQSQPPAGGNPGLSQWVFELENAPSTTGWSFTYACTMPGGDSMYWTVREFNGVITSGALDEQAQNNGDSINQDSGTTPATTLANELTLAVFSCSGNGGINPTGPYTNGFNALNAADQGTMAYKFNTAAGTQNTGQTISKAPWLGWIGSYIAN